MKSILATLFFLLASLTLRAQGSYLYLEPIKGLPCKVLVNQKEVPLLTKNYFLLPLNGNGEYVFELVFGGNLHPRQTFVVDVVEGAAYGFKLAKTAENKFYLLDLVNAGKIVETNTAVNLALTTEENVIHYFDPQATIVGGAVDPEPRRGGLFRKNKQQAPAPDQTQPQTQQSSQPEQFGVVQVITAKAEGENQKEQTDAKPARCQSAATAEEVSLFAAKLAQKNDDESKLILMRKKIFTGCLTCSQLFTLSETLKTQYGRFSSLKIMQPLLSDPGNIRQLEPLFRTDSYKSKLRELR